MIEYHFSTKDEAVGYIIEAIEGGGAVADARDEYDVEAIAGDLIVCHCEYDPDGATIASSLYYFIDADEDYFWEVVAAHERV